MYIYKNDSFRIWPLSIDCRSRQYVAIIKRFANFKLKVYLRHIGVSRDYFVKISPCCKVVVICISHRVLIMIKHITLAHITYKHVHTRTHAHTYTHTHARTHLHLSTDSTAGQKPFKWTPFRSIVCQASPLHLTYNPWLVRSRQKYASWNSLNYKCLQNSQFDIRNMVLVSFCLVT